MNVDVFLGGACGDTTWRSDVAIPALEAAGVSYYNPQVPAGKWHDGLVEVEAAAKRDACAYLFVITGDTRAVASLVEAATLSADGGVVYLVVQDIPEGMSINGWQIYGEERKDLNRGRAYLRSAVAPRANVWMFSEVTDAVDAVVSLMGRSPR